MIRRIIIFLILVSAAGAVRGQYFSTGQDPAATRWISLKSDRYRVIYPAASQAQARYLAAILDLAIPAETSTLKAKMPRMPVILHTRTVVSNGVTTWAPKRIEMYTCPPQDTYAEIWIEQLALHEYRHAVQISKMNQGFTKGLSYVLGEQGTGAMLGLFLPPWFLEGDATCAETALSLTGRGRSPSFQAKLKAQLIEKGTYSYDKATLGSYKTFVPGSYELGYHLVGYGRVKYGPGLWNFAVDRSAKLPFMVVPFASGIRHETGLTKTGFYRSAMAHFDSIWRTEAARTSTTPFRMITRPDPRNYTSFIHPVHISDTLFLAARFSNEGPADMVAVGPSGQVQRLFRLGSYQDESNSAAGRWVAWAETTPHIRWQHKSYSVIRLHDLESGHTRTLTPRSRYFSPVLSPDGTRIATVRVDELDRSRIDILTIPEGKVSRSYPAPGNAVILYPSWSPDGRQLTLTLLDAKGKSIEVLDLESGKFRNELPSTFTALSGPSFFIKHYLVFTGSYSGVDNLFALDTITSRLYQVNSSRYGSGDPDFSSARDRMIYSELTADGLMIAEKEVDPSAWTELLTQRQIAGSMTGELAALETVNVQQAALDQHLARILDTTAASGSLPAITGIETKYRRGLHLFNPHSWAPVSVSASNQTLDPGVSVLSQNVLGTAITEAGYAWDVNEQTGKGYLNFSYQGWFPVIDFQASYGKRAGTARVQQTGERKRFTWNETELDLDVSLPLNFSSGAWYRYLTPHAGSGMIYVDHDKTTPSGFTEGWVPTLKYRLWYANYIRSNYQDVYPKWGHTANLGFNHGLGASNNPGWITAATLNLYFPGIFPHHGILLSGAFQKRTDNKVYGYTWSNMISYPRGVTDAYDNEVFSLSANYTFPFLRADLSLGSLMYIKRFKLNLFYDWAQGWDDPGTQLYSSVGAGLTIEMNILRFLAPFELGARAEYLPYDNTWGWAFLYSVNL